MPSVFLPAQSLALSDSVVIQQLQTGGTGTGTATQEFILLLNRSSTDVNVSGWCLRYSSASDATVGFSVCLQAPDAATELWLKSGGQLSIATQSFVDSNPGFVPDYLITGGMAAAGGHVRLVNGLIEIDKVGWGTAVNPETLPSVVHAAGQVLGRDSSATTVDTDNNSLDFTSRNIEPVIVSGLFEVEIVVDVCPNLADLQELVPDGYLLDETGACQLDFCLNIDGLQVAIPIGYARNELYECTLIPLEGRVLFITELLPNTPGVDTGFEFIELYNPHNELINLVGYRLQVGPSYTKEFIFSEGTIKAGEYLVLSDTVTNIVLPNSSGVSLRLIAPDGNTVSSSASYFNADDEDSWSLVDDAWIFTNQITPALPNKPSVQPVLDDEEIDTVTIFAPCPAGKYRNPLTNRCRALETAVSVLTPCDEDEFRNPETNRCKALITTASTLAPCGVGQARNPDTNRCRKTTTAESALTPCDPGEERNPETNRCRKVQTLGVSSENDLAMVQDAVAVTNAQGRFNWPLLIGAIGAIGGYASYEWRHEIKQKLRLFKKR